MRDIKVKVHPSKSNLKKEDQLAWKIAEIASDKAKLDKDAVDMVINRIIDNAAVAIASFNRAPVISARAMALAHSRKKGATVFGLNPKIKVDCEWAAWANGTAVRELDYHDTFLAADYSHPGEYPEDTKFNFILNISNLKIIPDDYEVEISSKLISHFINPRMNVKYWIALEKSSTFGE